MKYDIEWVGLLLIREKKVLMTREEGKELFQLPGGGKESGESDIATLTREVSEELSVQVKNPVFYTKFILPGRHEGVMIQFTIYTGEINEEIEKGDEIAELKWVDSKFEQENIDIGNPMKLVLIEELLKNGKIS